MATITMKELLEAGVHFGHLTRKWNPKMKKYIFGSRNGIHILDLRHSLKEFHKAGNFTTDIAAQGGKVLFVGTKRQAQDSIKEAALRIGMPYVTERWLGGTLTNHRTIMTRVQRLKELEKIEEDPKFENITKKERLLLEKERIKLDRMLSGIRDMLRLPSAIFVVDLRREKNCIAEARKLGIPVVAMVDTNCDPDITDFPIPANDDAVRSISLFTNRIADSAQEGLDIYQSRMEDEAQEVAMQEKIARDTGALPEEEKKAKRPEPRRVKAQTRKAAGTRERPTTRRAVKKAD